jgi:UDP-N-acetylglucosamine acyltransferase
MRGVAYVSGKGGVRSDHARTSDHEIEFQKKPKKKPQHEYTSSDRSSCARIAEKVEIGPFTTIYGDVEIGEGSWIGPNVTIMDGARIGRNCRIFPGSVISAIPQDLKFEGEITTTEIGDNTTIRECCTLNQRNQRQMENFCWVPIASSWLMCISHMMLVVGNNCILGQQCQRIAGHVDYRRLGHH